MQGHGRQKPPAPHQPSSGGRMQQDGKRQDQNQQNPAPFSGLSRRGFLGGAGTVALATASGLLLPSTAHAATTITTNQTCYDGMYYAFGADGGGSVSRTHNSGGSSSTQWTICGNFAAGKGWGNGWRRTVRHSGYFS